MPPRASLTNTFSVTDINNEVVCPLRNQDGSSCRKRCLGEKRFRSMQEHIRRAHPEYYIPKLPATKESFELMISTPPHERPQQDPNHAAPQQQQQQQQSIHHQQQHSDPSGLSPAFQFDSGLSSSYPGYGHALGQHDGGYYTAGDTDAAAIFNSMQAQRQMADEHRRGSLIPAANAAAALASLHYHRPDSDWGGDNMGQVILPSLQMSPTLTEADFLQNFYANQHDDLKTNHFHVDPALEDMSFMPDHNAFPASSSADTPGLLPSSLARSPPERPATMATLQRSLSRNQQGRPRQKSFSYIRDRVDKQNRRKSKEFKRLSGERKALSAEPNSAAALYGKRWEDLIDAATSATEEDSRDLTPIPDQGEGSPQVPSRTSLPPFALGSQFQSFQASPLNRALTPPPADSNLADLQPFPSVESSLSSHQHHNSTSSGSQFQIMNPSSLTGTNSESSPMFQQHPVQIYCAGCRRLNVLKESFACTNCICGLCTTCVEALLSGQRTGRMSYCPRCNEMSAFKPFQLDLR